MSSISVTTSGNWETTTSQLRRLLDSQAIFSILDKYGAQGVAALAAATPTNSGLTAESWTYEIVNRSGYYAIHWSNTNVEDGIPIAILIQYGHGTKNGGYVQGRDYIMPAIQPIFDQMANEIWKEVTR